MKAEHALLLYAEINRTWKIFSFGADDEFGEVLFRQYEVQMLVDPKTKVWLLVCSYFVTGQLCILELIVTEV